VEVTSGRHCTVGEAFLYVNARPFAQGQIDSEATSFILPMDRAFADAVIHFALWRDPERVSEVIADVGRQLEAKGYSVEEIRAALDELLAELDGHGQPRH
jgi:hypothetical protein